MVATPVRAGGPALELDDIQGLVARGYGNLRAACFILAHIDDPRGAASWLRSITDEVTPASDRPQEHGTHVAFTSGGLSRLGLRADSTRGFSAEFVGGMTTPHRRRLLGDVDGSAPERWAWGGPTTSPIDVALLLYARDPATLETVRADHAARLAAGGLREVATLETRPLDAFEHFGFHDGISQPIVRGLSKRGSWSETVRAGEFVLGYPNEYGLLTASPAVPAEDDPRHVLPAHRSGGGHDFGRNGSYLVLRQLRQYVHRFWRFVDGAAEDSRDADRPAARIAVASKMVGRWPSGAPLVRSPAHDDERLAGENDFTYHDADPAGDRCPIGAHVRRANPRDSLDPDPGSRRSVAVGKRHRLLRRGRSYGPRIDIEAALRGDDESDDERGLHFLCLSGNLARQFEFVQHSWINDPTFGDLYQDPDPLVGIRTSVGRAFTMQGSPVRRRIRNLPEFVSVRGGAYLFLPGIRALRYLAQ